MANMEPRDELITHLPALRSFALSLTRNQSTADDMVQDTVVSAWAKIDSYVSGTNMRAWLFTILRNNFYSSRRKLNREVADSEGHFAATLSVKPDHDGRLQLAEFRRVFEQLPDEQREALILVGASGFTYEEAAQTCGVAIGTIKSRANRARAKMAELLNLEEEGLGMTDAATSAIVNRSGT